MAPLANILAWTMRVAALTLCPALFIVSATPACAQNACTAAGIDPGCCALVCANNPLCCSVAWDASCNAQLAAADCLCSNAVPISGASAVFTTTSAMRDVNLAGLCDPGPFGDDTLHNCAILTWTPPVTERYTFTTCNTAPFDSRIAVLAGCSRESVIGCNDDGDNCASFTSILSVDLLGGQRYTILVGGYSEADVGPCTLAIESFHAQLTLQGAHQWEVSAGGNGHWYAQYDVGPGASWTDLQTAAESLGGTLACANSAAESRLLGSLCAAMSSGSAVAIGLYQDLGAANYIEPAGAWKWIDGTALRGTHWSVGEPNNALSQEHFGRLAATATSESWFDHANEGGWTNAIIEFGVAGLPGGAAPPSNDEASTATPLELGQFNTVSLVGATTSSDPQSCTASIYYDRWYSFVATSNAHFDVVACGNGFAGALAVYDQATRTLIGCSNGQCTLTLPLVLGKSYLIRIGSAEGDRAGIPTLIAYPTPDVVSLDSISVNFVGGTLVDGSDGGYCVETAVFPAGAASLGTLQWSNLVGANTAAATAAALRGLGDSPVGLRDGHGTATASSVQFAVNNTWRIFSFPENDTERMRQGFLDTNGLASLSVSVVSVPYRRYSAVVYFGAEVADRLGSISANGLAPIYFKTDATPSGTYNALVEATARNSASATRASYAVFHGLTAKICDLRLVEFGPNVGLQGFQLIEEATPCPGDLDQSGDVDAQDLAALLSGWGTAAADITGDGTTNALDLATMLGAWGVCPGG